MARFGRAQPHPPIFLRAPLVAVVAAAATVSPIHVIQAEARRPPVTHVYYLRPSRTSSVPDKPAPQVHFIGAGRSRVGRPADVLFIRNPQAPAAAPAAKAPASHVIIAKRVPIPLPRAVIIARSYTVDAVVDPGKATPQIHVVGAVPHKASRRPDSVVIYLRPSRTSLVPDRFAQIHVLLQPRERALPATHVTLLRNAPAPAAPFGKLAPQVHVVSLTVLRASHRPEGVVLYVRPSRTSLVPDRLPVRIHVVGQVGGRLRVVREPMLLYRHGGPLPPVVSALPLQVVDLGDDRYLVTDESGNRYLVREAGFPRYGVEDV